MASDTPIFLRPIEINSENDGININVGGGGAVTRNITNGVYGSIVTLLYEIMNTTLAAEDIVCYLTSQWKVAIYNSSFTTFVIDWSVPDSNNRLRDILGFSADLTGAATYSGTYTASHIWLPTFAMANRAHWELDQNKAIKGVNAQNGRFAGFGFGPDVRGRKMEFMYEPAVNVADEFALTTYDEARNFESFVYTARAAQPSRAASPSIKGFYYVPDNSIYTGGVTGANLIASMDSGGVNYNYSSSPDTYTFCALTRRVTTEQVALANTRTRYNVAIEAISATAPTWDGEA